MLFSLSTFRGHGHSLDERQAAPTQAIYRLLGAVRHAGLSHVHAGNARDQNDSRCRSDKTKQTLAKQCKHFSHVTQVISAARNTCSSAVVLPARPELKYGSRDVAKAPKASQDIFKA